MGITYTGTSLSIYEPFLGNGTPVETQHYMERGVTDSIAAPGTLTPYPSPAEGFCFSNLAEGLALYQQFYINEMDKVIQGGPWELVLAGLEQVT